MNALNILSGLNSTPPASPPRSRTASSSNVNTLEQEAQNKAETDALGLKVETQSQDEQIVKHESDSFGADNNITPDEKTPLLQKDESYVNAQPTTASGWLLPKRIANALVNSLRLVLTAILAPGHYFVTCFYDEQGHFSASLPARRVCRIFWRRRRRKPAEQPIVLREESSDGQVDSEKSNTGADIRKSQESTRAPSPLQRGDTPMSDSESDRSSLQEVDDKPARNTRSKTSTRDEIAPARKSIRIKLHNDAALNKQKRHRAQRSIDGIKSEEDQVAAVANSLKSPSSPLTTKLKYPRAPVPPRPLVPRRQPSYSNLFNAETPKKTLVIDLDETLIHSMAKGGRMSTGHMVEVKFSSPIGSGGLILGPQVPILYYVHERPYCHEFLRKVCKWYNLIVFTASVQEYADPVIDYLERERKYFAGRYYRQHCTLRNGAYIKDLSQVEPDLSKVMILDNSPMSYIFHEDNAIPIEGWISDPTDNDLLHLVPMLEGLQYATDVRALLALRLGQAERG